MTYGLQTAWLPVAARRRLDGFHAKCLRRICGIPPSFISRVSNADVLTRAGCSMKLSSRIRVQQLVLAGRCAAAPVGTPMREALQQSVGIEGDRVRHGRPMCLQRLRRWLALLTSCRPPRLTRPSGGGRWFYTASELTNRERCAGQWVRSAGPHTWCVCVHDAPQLPPRFLEVDECSRQHTHCVFFPRVLSGARACMACAVQPPRGSML